MLFLYRAGLEAGQLVEAHVEDGLRLDVGEGELRHQLHLGFEGVLGFLYDLYDGVDVLQGYQVAFQDVGAGQGLLQVVLGPVHHHQAAVAHVLEHHFFDGQHAGPAVHDGQHDHAEGSFHLRVLIKQVQNHLGIAVALDLDDDAHAAAVRLVADIGNIGDLLLFHEFGDGLDEGGLVHLVGDLGDRDAFAVALHLLYLGAGLGGDGAAAGLEVIFYAFAAADDAAGREVGTLDDLHQLFGLDVRVVHHRDGRVADLGEVMGGNIGGHADRDAGGAVDEEVGELARQHRRLGHGPVVVGDELHRLFLDVGQELAGYAAEARLGITHRCGGVAVHGTEVTLPVHQHIAQAEGLGHADEGVVDGSVAVRVVLTHHVADDAGAFLEGLVVLQAHVVHGVQHAAVHRLQAVAHVGQGPADYDAHGVVDIGGLHLLADIAVDDVDEHVFRLLRCKVFRFCHFICAPLIKYPGCGRPARSAL